MNFESNYTPDTNKENSSVVVEGSPKDAKDNFFKSLEKRTQIIDDDRFKKMFPGLYIAAFSNLIVFNENTQKKRIKGIAIYINKDDFIINSEDYSDLIPIVLRHEIAEIWYASKTGFSMSPPPKAIGKKGRAAFAHALALREEYRYAFELGKAERLLEFLTKHHVHIAPSKTSSEENRRTYELVRQRIQKDKKSP